MRRPALGHRHFLFANLERMTCAVRCDISEGACSSANSPRIPSLAERAWSPWKTGRTAACSGESVLRHSARSSNSSRGDSRHSERRRTPGRCPPPARSSAVQMSRETTPSPHHALSADFHDIAGPRNHGSWAAPENRLRPRGSHGRFIAIVQAINDPRRTRRKELDHRAIARLNCPLRGSEATPQSRTIGLTVFHFFTVTVVPFPCSETIRIIHQSAHARQTGPRLPR